MRHILFTRSDGGVSIVSTPVDTDEALAKAMAKLPAFATNAKIVDSAAIPQDRTFRNAWRQNGSLGEHDMGKARGIHREALRRLRAPKLAALDTAYLRADEMGDAPAKARIAAEKQALRDVTDDPAIDTASTPETLRAAIPNILR